MSNLGRMKDLADVQELIRSTQLPGAFSRSLDPTVEPKFLELWDGYRASPNVGGG